jgi:sulfur carrier protein ThiS
MGIDSMKISVTILPDNSFKEVDIKSGSIIYDLLKKINLNPDALIILKDNKPIPIDDILKEDEKLTILKVASGG